MWLCIHKFIAFRVENYKTNTTGISNNACKSVDLAVFCYLLTKIVASCYEEIKKREKGITEKDTENVIIYVPLLHSKFVKLFSNNE